MKSLEVLNFLTQNKAIEIYYSNRKCFECPLENSKLYVSYIEKRTKQEIHFSPCLLNFFALAKEEFGEEKIIKIENACFEKHLFKICNKNNAAFIKNILFPKLLNLE